MPFPKRCGLVHVTGAGAAVVARMLSSEPGHTDIEYRDVPAPTAWQVVTLTELPNKKMLATFEASGFEGLKVSGGHVQRRGRPLRQGSRGLSLRMGGW